MTTKSDFNLNIDWLKSEFYKESVIVAADPEGKTRGIIARRLRRDWLGDLLIATGHRVTWATGKVEYIRKPREETPGWIGPAGIKGPLVGVSKSNE